MRLIAMGVILAWAILARPVRADDECARFNHNLDLVEQEHQDAIRELNRVSAMTPAPTHDAILCMSMRKFANDIPYLSNPPADCFDKPDDVQAFSDQLESFMSSAGTIVGLFCTPQEQHSPVTSKVDSCALSGC